MARWKAWLCRFGMPGRTTPESRSAPAASAPASTASRSPRRVDLEPDAIREPIRQQRRLGKERSHAKSRVTKGVDEIS